MASAGVLKDSHEFPLGNSGIENDDKNYACPICLEPFRDPRSLPCSHIFCEDCLQTYISNVVRKDSVKLWCPSCRQTILSPTADLPYDKWAKSFPLANTTTSKQKADESCQSKTAEYCEVCLRDGKNVVAEFYCSTCCEAICFSCKKVHALIQAYLQSHTILALEVIRRNGDLYLNKMCRRHPCRDVEAFCFGHEEVCCSICVLKKHRQCNEVKTLDDCASNMRNEDCMEFMKKMESVFLDLDDEMKKKGETAKKISESLEAKMSEIVVKVEAAKKNLNMLLEKFEHDVNEEHARNLRELSMVLRLLGGIRESIIFYHEKLELMMKYGTKQDLFIFMEEMKTKLAGSIKKVAKRTKHSIIYNGYNVQLVGLEDSLKLDGIGSVQGISDERQFPITSMLKKQLALLPGKKSDPTKFRFKLDERYNINVTCALPCYAFAFMWKYLLILFQDKTIALFSEEGKLVLSHTIPYPEEPAAVQTTNIIDKDIYVSFRKQKILKKYNIMLCDITEVGEIKLQNVAEGFCVFEDKIVHASATLISISTLSGVLVKTIIADVQGQIAFLAGLPQKGFFCHADGNQLYLRDLNGTEIKVLSLSPTGEVSGPRGIAFDHQGNIYVCCYRAVPPNLLQISHQDFSLRKVVIATCYSVAFHPDGTACALLNSENVITHYKVEME